MKQAATVLSFLLHPILLPAIFMVFLLSTPYYLNSFLHRDAFRVLIITILIFTFFFPLLIISLSRLMDFIESFFLDRPQERVFALLLMAVSSYLTYRLLLSYELPSYYTLFLLLITGILLLGAFISIFYKISIHSMGWGAVIALIIVYLIKFDLAIVQFLIPVFFISGIISWARIEVEAHKPIQVYMGFGLSQLILLSLLF